MAVSTWWTAYLNSEVVTANLNDEVSKGHTMGPFSTPPFQNFQVSHISLVPKKHSDKFRMIFHLSYPKSGTSSMNYFIEKDDFSLQYITIDNAIAAIQNFGQGCYMGKTDIESPFCLIPATRMTGNFWGYSGTGSTILTRCSHLGFALAHTFLTNCPIPLNGFYSTTVLFPLSATSWTISS